MKIGLIAPPWLPVPPGQYGGTESVIDRVARGLVKAGHEVLLAAPDGSSCPVPRVAGLGTADPDRIGQVVIEIPYALAAYEALRGVDIVHDHTVAGPEPFGLVMIESLACGTPVVASSDGSVPEIVTDGVTGFIREDTPSVAEALRQVTTLSRAACREAAETSFSTTRMVADHVELYEQLLTRGGASTSP